MGGRRRERPPARVVRLIRFDPGNCDAARVELLGVGLMLRAGEHVDLGSPSNVLEAGAGKDPLPLCFQQSTGNSARPEVDVILRLLRHFLVYDDVADLEAAARLQDAVDLP